MLVERGAVRCDDRMSPADANIRSVPFASKRKPRQSCPWTWKRAARNQYSPGSISGRPVARSFAQCVLISPGITGRNRSDLERCRPIMSAYRSGVERHATSTRRTGNRQTDVPLSVVNSHLKQSLARRAKFNQSTIVTLAHTKIGCDMMGSYLATHHSHLVWPKLRRTY